MEIAAYVADADAELTEFIVSRTSKTNSQFMEHGQSNPGSYIAFVSSAALVFFSIVRIVGPNQSVFSNAVDHTDDTYRLYERECDGTHAGHRAWVNGVELARTDTLTDDPASTAAATQIMALGSEEGLSRFQQGGTCGGIRYPFTLSVADRERVRQYFNDEYLVF